MTEKKKINIRCAEKRSIQMKRVQLFISSGCSVFKRRTNIKNTLGWCSYLWRASHPHHGHDGRAETQRLLQTAVQQAQVFQLRTTPGLTDGSFVPLKNSGKHVKRVSSPQSEGSRCSDATSVTRCVIRVDGRRVVDYDQRSCSGL